MVYRELVKEAQMAGEMMVIYECDGRRISADRTKCVGCFRCALACSFRFEEAFNPIDAKIRVVPPDRSTIPGESEISFADDCDCCGLCAKACAYGALAFEKKMKK